MSQPYRPRLTPGLRFIERVEDGRTFFVVKDTMRMKYFRFGPPEVSLMRLLDGERTLPEVARGLGATPEAVEPFVRRLKELGLVERGQEEKRVLLMESIRRQRKLRLQGHGNTLFRMRFSLGDPDVLFDRVVPRLQFFFSPAFVLLSLGAFALYGIILALYWDAVISGMARLYDPSQYTLGFLAGLYGVSLLILAIHELGHGFTCKHFGGEVHEIGAMLFYFSPAFFCNVNDAWTFDKLSHRLWVTFAGGWIQLFLGAIAALIWVLAEPGTMVSQLAFAGIIIGGGAILLINFNPLIPLDGYYALMDWLKIPNLRPRSFQYLSAWTRRHVLRLDAPVPDVTPRERRIFLTYGIASLVYTTVILAVFALFIGGLVAGAFGAWGVAILGFIAWRVARGGIRSAGSTLRAWAADKLGPGSRRPVLLWSGAALLLLVAAGFLPWTIRAAGPATVEPLDRAWLWPPEPAIVASVLAAEGDTVRAGEAVIALRSPELEMELAVAHAAVAALRREVEAARAGEDAARVRGAGIALDERLRELAALERRSEALRLRAPFAAIVVTPHAETRVHRRALPGDSLIELWSTGPLRLRIVLAQRDGGEVHPGHPVGVRFPHRPSVTWRTRVARVGAATRDGEIEVLAALGTPEGVRPGMVGQAKIALRQDTLAGLLLRTLRRTFRTDWLL